MFLASYIFHKYLSHQQSVKIAYQPTCIIMFYASSKILIKLPVVCRKKMSLLGASKFLVYKKMVNVPIEFLFTWISNEYRG